MPRDIRKILLELDNENKPVSYHLLRNLSELTDAELAQFQSAWADFTPTRRVELMRALVSLAEEHVEFHYNAIFAWTLNDTDPQVRVQSIEGLWEDQNTQFIDQFQHFLLYDADVDVRAAAALALGRFIHWGEMDEIPGRYADQAVEALWAVYHDPREHVHVRRRALEGIALSSHPGAPRLIESAHFDEDPFMRASALYAMGRSADVRWIPYLLPELENESPELRMEAARALGELESTAAVDPMIRMLDTEKDSEVRFAILEALGQIGGEKAKQALQLAIDSENEAEAEIAEIALEQLYAGVNNLFELIDEVMGVESEAALTEASDAWDDFYEDPTDVEIRRLLDEEDRF